MIQKREVIITICIADDSIHHTDIDKLIKRIEPSVKALVGEDNLLFIEHLDDEWGEAV